MKFEKTRPIEVNKAIKSGDREKVVAFARAGGKANAKRIAVEEMRKDAELSIHEESMRHAAEARRDGLLPADD